MKTLFTAINHEVIIDSEMCDDMFNKCKKNGEDTPF